VNAAEYSAAGEKYQSAIMEQYKLYVEMADRISSRRVQANAFFLTLNTAVFTLVASFWTKSPLTHAVPRGWLVAPLLVLVVECATWYLQLRSYRQLASTKWRVVGALEEKLPSSPWWRAERDDLDRHQDRYLRLALVERIVPVLFALAYVGAFLVALFI
jgi:hypothetical protein